MKSVVIYYFSGTGNTWWVANMLQQKLKKLKHEVQCYSIETLEAENIAKQVNDADHVILGFAVYGSTTSQNMIDFLKGIPDSTKQQTVSVFATHALGSGDSAHHIGQIIVKKGYNLKQAVHFRMMNNFHIPKFRFYRPKNDYRIDKLQKKALPKLERLALAISDDQKFIVGNNALGHFLGNLQRRHIGKVIKIVSKEFKVDATRCVDCNKCVGICPMQNIKMHQGSYIFEDNCILCLRCYSQCSKYAILIGQGSKDVKKYPRYRGPGKHFDIYKLIKNKSK